jgi:hypothetical protein
MKTSLGFVMLLVLVVGISAPVLAIDGEFKNASQWCKANNDLDYSNHGQCVRSVTACYGRGNSGPVCACKDYLDNDPDGFYVEYNNLGECVSHLRQGFVDNN